MVPGTDATAAHLVSRDASTGEDTRLRLITGLSRSLAGDGISDDLYDVLNDVLHGYAPVDEGGAERIAHLFRRAAGQLVHIVPHHTLVHPTEERVQQDRPRSLTRATLAVLGALQRMTRSRPAPAMHRLAADEELKFAELCQQITHARQEVLRPTASRPQEPQEKRSSACSSKSRANSKPL